jgi:hypothetical protein
VDPFTRSWLDPEDVRHWLRINAAAGDDDALEVDRVCVQTEIYVQRCRPDAYTVTEPTDPDPPVAVYVPDAEIYQGAVMYAARQLRRRASPGGVESFGDVGITFVTKYDADIERSLRTGGWSLPGVG